jgi:hypothetical protein
VPHFPFQADDGRQQQREAEFARLQPSVRVGHAGGRELVTYREHGRYFRFRAGTANRHAIGIEGASILAARGSAAFRSGINGPPADGPSGSQAG